MRLASQHTCGVYLSMYVYTLDATVHVCTCMLVQHCILLRYCRQGTHTTCTKNSVSQTRLWLKTKLRVKESFLITLAIVHDESYCLLQEGYCVNLHKIRISMFWCQTINLHAYVQAITCQACDTALCLFMRSSHTVQPQMSLSFTFINAALGYDHKIIDTIIHHVIYEQMYDQKGAAHLA